MTGLGKGRICFFQLVANDDEKIVVCPKRGLTDDFYPEEWIKI